jgi:hypothetical protein
MALNQLQYLPRVDQIVLLKQGRVAQVGMILDGVNHPFGRFFLTISDFFHSHTCTINAQEPSHH